MDAVLQLIQLAAGLGEALVAIGWAVNQAIEMVAPSGSDE